MRTRLKARRGAAFQSGEPASGPACVEASRDAERGFALLIVFLLAAAVALMLYQQLPRVAFESEREKEQLLIDRGEQYKRAIQMYVVEYKKYPAKLEDLENTNNKRYLRRRYIDPMTGKDEWRVIHANAVGQLTDSLVQKPPAPGLASGASGATGATAATGAAGATGADSQTAVNPFVGARPSDRVAGQPTITVPPAADPNDPRYWPPITLTPSGPTGATGPSVIRPPGFPTPTGQTPGTTGFQPGPPGFNPMNPQGNPTSPQFGPNGPTIPLPNNAGQQINLQTGQVQPPQPFGAPAPGAPGAPPNPALDLINAQLRGQRPQDPNATAAPGNFGSGGIAGVASTFKGPSIKVYNERQKYQEWEFIFDPKKGMPGQQGVPQNSNPLGSPGLGSPGLGSPGLGSPGLGSANPQPPANPLQPPPPKQ